MDGKGRWVDNVFVEWLWRSVKYEEVYLKAYDKVAYAKRSLGNNFTYLQYRKTTPIARQTDARYSLQSTCRQDSYITKGSAQTAVQFFGVHYCC